MQEHSSNPQPDHKIVRSLSYNDLKKKRMLREQRSKKRLQSHKKSSNELTRSTTSSKLNHNKYIKEIPLNQNGMNDFIFELKGVINELQNKSVVKVSKLDKTEGNAKIKQLQLDSLKTRICGQKNFFSNRNPAKLSIKLKNKENNENSKKIEDVTELQDMSRISTIKEIESERTELSILKTLKESNFKHNRSKIPRDFFK